MSPTSRRQAVLLTAVPRGIVLSRTGGQRLRIGVHVSPRLSYSGDGGTLASFPDWLSWPSQAVTWQVRFNGQTLATTVVSARPDPDTWEAIFRPTLRVDSFTGDPGPSRSVAGYSYGALEGYLREAYTGDLGFGRSPFSQAARAALGRRGWQPGTGPATTAAEAVEHYLAFWGPTDTSRAPGVRGRLDADFHDRLSLVGDHAPLLERLGLVVVLDAPAVTAPRDTTVQVLASWTPASGVETQVVTPRTLAVYDQTSPLFAARRRTTTNPEHTERLHLATGSRAFSTHSLHVDAAAAGSIGVAAGEGNEGDTGAAPTSGGITLALVGRMRRVQSDLTAAEVTARATVTNPANPPDRYAEDLIVGHHIEVGLGQDQEFYGLGHRQVTYKVVEGDQTVVEFTAVDEGAVTAVGRQASATDPSSLLVSDVVMRWDGWSLAVPRPGVHQLQDDPRNASIDPAPGRPADTWLTLETTMPDRTVDGGDPRLPLLRYGQVYSVRGRAVDVTGGRPSWDGALETPRRTYWRFDPAPAPLVLPPSNAKLTRGESARAVVVRSNPRSGELPTVKSSRTLVPPRATIDTGLLHGWFDEDGVPSRTAYELIDALDRAELPRRGPDPAGPTREPVARVVDWLPDPMTTAVHIGLLAEDGDEADSRDPSFLPPSDDDGGKSSLTAWQSVALLVEGVAVGAYPTLAQSEQSTPHRVVTIGLPPASSARVALRAQPSDDTLALHGLVDWDPSGSFDETVARVREGGLPQLTPTTYVDVVHAVRQPLADPYVDDPDFTRPAGRKDPTVQVPVEVHSNSASRVTLYASWTERIDDGPRSVAAGIVKPTTRKVTRTRIVETSIDLNPDGEETSLTMAGVVPFSDLRRRDVTLTAVATSRFVAEFRQPITLESGGLLPADVDPESVAVLRKAYKPGTEPSPLALDRDYRITAQGARWKLSLEVLKLDQVAIEGVKGTVLATSQPSVVTPVPSAVRPEPPKVLYAVPAFSVGEPERDDEGGWHGGRGASRLRIYLERPWWSSGDGEGLAVVTRTDVDLSEDPEGTSPAARLSTLYGADPTLTPGQSPVYEQDLTSGVPVTNLSLDELDAPPGSTYDARVHEVLYDATRDLYYTEIQVLPQPAGTFVRLAVARFQPEVSVGISNLSRIVAMDPVQLLPPRELTVIRRTSSGGDAVQVLVTGATHRGALETSAPLLKVSLQVKAVRGAGDDLGWDTVSVATKRARTDGEGFDRVTAVVPDDARGEMRVLVEELETWLSEDERGALVDPWPVGKNPTSFAQAEAHLRARRVTWVATTPMPTAPR